MSNEFKKLSDVDVLEELSENTHVIVEDGGKLKRYSAATVGGTSTPTIFRTISQWVGGDEDGWYETVTTCNKTYDECLEEYNNNIFNAFVNDGAHEENVTTYMGVLQYANEDGTLRYYVRDQIYGYLEGYIDYFPDGTIQTGTHWGE